MDALAWEMSVLSRAVAYKNLSGAAHNVGLSQPQLSRIIQRLESELKLTLLDRTSRRASGWLPAAYRLAEIYAASAKRLEREIQTIAEPEGLRHLRIGTLEGLIPVVVPFGDQLFRSCGVSELEVDVHDLSRLEEQFFKGAFDLVFTSAEPGRRKFPFSKIVGYQALERLEKSAGTWVMSPFEYGTRRHQWKKKKPERLVVSNSLHLRQAWLDMVGGTGIIPSALRKDKPAKSEPTPVYLIGSDALGTALWEKIDKIRIL